MNTEELRKLLDEATPGPWVVVPDKTAAQVQGYPCIYANDYTIVGTEGMYGEIEKDFANARLIAMAPTLARKVIAAEKLAEALRQSQLQIEYLHAKLGENMGSGNAVYVRNAAALAAWEAAQ